MNAKENNRDSAEPSEPRKPEADGAEEPGAPPEKDSASGTDDPQQSAAIDENGELAEENAAGEEVEFDLEAQIEVFREQIAGDPENCVHHYNLGEALHELGRTDEAREAFQLALKYDHDKGFGAIIHFGLGSLYYHQLMQGTSANVVLSSVGLHSSHSDKVNITEVNDHEYQLPIDEFEAAIRDLPLLKADEEIYEDISSNAPLNIAHTYYKWGSDLIDKARQLNRYGDEIEDVRRAQKFLKKALKIDPNNSAAALLANVSQKMLAQGWKTYDEYGFEAKDIPGTG
ncbi:MAG: tetratricopeptide repeat protein [Nitrospinales bacterium]